MAWNEPGSGPRPGGDGQDPWGRKPSDAPDSPGLLDKLAGGEPGGERQVVRLLLTGAIALWVLCGFYRVDQAERAVVLRFGAFHGITTAGLHWHPPLIDSVSTVNVEHTEQLPISETVITSDESIVDLSLSVQYRITDPRLYVLGASDPEDTLKHVTESAVRHAVGNATMAEVLSEGRDQVVHDIQPRLQDSLDRFQTGLSVRSVNILDVLPPKEVKSAFDDVIRATEDKGRMQNQAETYANGILPEARGQAARMIADAEADKQESIDHAQADVARFQGLMAEYRQSPSVLRTRLYYDTMEAVLSKASQVVIEPKDTHLSLTLAKSVAAGVQAPAATPDAPAAASAGSATPAAAAGQPAAQSSVLTRDASRPGRNLEDAR